MDQQHSQFGERLIHTGMYACIYIPDSLEAATHAALLDLALSVSPRVEETASGTVTLDLAGLDRIFGTSEKIARYLERRASELGLAASVAAASNPDAAIHAARGFHGITIIPPGQETVHLDGLPVSVLMPPPLVLETLERWGVRTFRSLAALPTVELAERLGQEGVHLQKLARGRIHRTLVPCEAPLHFEEVLELDFPVTLLEPLAFVLSRLLNQLCARLKAHSLATQEMRLRLEFETVGSGFEVRDSGFAEERGWRDEAWTGNPETRTPDPEPRTSRTLTLPVPTTDVPLLLKLWLFNLKSDPPPQPIVKVALAAEPVKPRTAQGGLFLPPAPDPAKLEVTLARISGVVGKERVGSPELVDTHRPGAFRMGRFIGVRDAGRTGVRDSGFGIRRNREPIALRIFRPPLPATVEMRDGRPVRVFAAGVNGDVVRAAGPWRTAGDWWRQGAWQQDEWDVELSSGLYRLDCDLATSEWFVRGSYD